MHYTDGYKTDSSGRATPCPQCSNSHYNDEDIHCRNCGLYLLNVCTNDFCNVTFIHDGSARYCFRCGSQSTFLSHGILNDWKPAKESILQIQNLEEDLCGIGNAPKEIEMWSLLVEALLDTPIPLLFQLLEGSDAKIYNQTLIIYVKDKDTKGMLAQEKYYDEIISIANRFLTVDVHDLHIVSFEEHLPAPETIYDNDVPF